MSRNLSLLLQSSSDALGDCLASLRRALDAVDQMDARGDSLPFSPTQLERAYAQCLNASRTIEGLAGRVRET